MRASQIAPVCGCIYLCLSVQWVCESIDTHTHGLGFLFTWHTPPLAVHWKMENGLITPNWIRQAYAPSTPFKWDKLFVCSCNCNSIGVFRLSIPGNDCRLCRMAGNRVNCYSQGVENVITIVLQGFLLLHKLLYKRLSIVSKGIVKWWVLLTKILYI